MHGGALASCICLCISPYLIVPKWSWPSATCMLRVFFISTNTILAPVVVYTPNATWAGGGFHVLSSALLECMHAT